MKWFRRRGSQLRALEARLGYRFSDPALLETALTHSSHAHERAATSYERLEFLGDALLGFVVSEWLYLDDEQAPEGVLTRRRQLVVRATTLAEAARALGLADALRLGRGEERSGGREKPSLMADTFEAVLGAVFLDGGIRPARAFVRRHLAASVERPRGTQDTGDDFKTALQEAVQARLRRTPAYRIVATSGPPHALRFEVEVLVDERVLGGGIGSTRKAAEQAAAQQALARIAAHGL